MDNDIRTTAEAAEDNAIPRAKSAHTDPAEQKGCAQEPLPRSVTAKPLKQKSAAEWAYERLILYIKKFEEQLDNEHEVAMGFTGAQAGVIRIEGIGFFDPDIVTFYGSDPTGSRTQLIQHVSQLNVLLRALPKSVGQEKPNRIGFRLAAHLETETETPEEAPADPAKA